MLSKSNILAIINSLERKNGLSSSIDDNNIDLGRTATNIFIQENTVIEGPLTGISSLYISGITTLQGATTILSSLNVSGVSTLQGATTVLSSLNVSGISTLQGATTILSSLNVSGVSTFNNDVRLTNIYSLLDANNINDNDNNYTINIVGNNINIGNDYSRVKINGTTTYVFTNELVTEDPLISLNYSGLTTLGARSTGFESYSDGSVVGYLKTNSTQDKYLIKAENTTTMFVATTDLNNNFTVGARLNVSGIT